MRRWPEEFEVLTRVLQGYTLVPFHIYNNSTKIITIGNENDNCSEKTH